MHIYRRITTEAQKKILKYHLVLIMNDKTNELLLLFDNIINLRIKKSLNYITIEKILLKI